MAKELPFFKFEVSEYMFGRIQKQPLDVQGTFINLCCRYWHKLGELPYEDANIDFDPEHIKSLLSARIIKDDSGFVVINFLDEQLNERAEVSKINSIKGKKSAELRAKRRSTKFNRSSTTVEPVLTGVQQQSTEPQPNSTEEKRRENIYTHVPETGISIAIKPVYINDRPVRVFDLSAYFTEKGQYESLRTMGWIHFDPFMQANAGKVFNDSDHLYNTFRAFCRDYKTPEASKKFEEAEYNKTLWTLPAWEKAYKWRLNNEPEFRKHFGYEELQNGTSVGLHNKDGDGLGRAPGSKA